MSRCDCEGVFYRVFCVSLLIIAFTFTVILTNVFVDIDNLLSKRERESIANVGAIEPITEGNEVTTEVQDYYVGVETNDQRNYRSKRSLGSENFILRINSPKAKSYLTNKLATLLEALDDEDQDITTPKSDNGNIYIKTVKQKNNVQINEMLPEIDKGEMLSDENIIHLALHDMLQGIGHVDKYQLIDKLQAVVKNLTHAEVEGSQKEIKNNKAKRRFYSETSTQQTFTVHEEHKDLTEHQLKYKIENKGARTNTLDLIDTTKAENKKGIKNKHPSYLLKTFIDIQKVGNAKSIEDLQGIIKLMYNGKPIKIKGEDDSDATTPTTTTLIKNMTTSVTENTLVNDVEVFDRLLRDKFKKRRKPDTYLKTLALEYLKKMEKSNNSTTVLGGKNKRNKRNVESSNEKQTELPHTKDDEELFVEIETHFDKSGMNGEKKRKLVSSLVEKIQSAIRSSHENTPLQDDNQRKPLMKRIQSPIDHETVLYHPNVPITSVYRTLDPISRLVPITDPLQFEPNLNSNSKKQYSQPKFLSLSKSINSAELNQVAVDYKLDNNESAIPKRVQLPLSIDTSRETINTEDVGKLQLLFKDIEGTGFSIGYNQYVDQAPDSESINLFHGIENLVKKYRQKNGNPDHRVDHEGDYAIYGQELKKREVKSVEAPLRTKRFVINRQNIKQSVKKANDHINGYVYDDHYHSFDSYKEVHDTSKSTTKFVRRSNGKSSIINAQRNKRSVTLKTIMNSNKKMRVNKYINTNVFSPQKRFFKINKRSKRQVDNTESIDKTGLPSENNNMFIFSDGNVYNDNLVGKRRQQSDLFFIEVIKSNKDDPFLTNKPLFQPSNYPFGSHTFKIQNQNMFNINPMFIKSNSNDYIRIQENKERIKRQLHTLRIFDRDTGLENSDHKGLTEYDDDIYAKKEVTSELDGPQVIPQEDENREYIVEYSNNGMKKTPVVYRNPFIMDNNKYNSFKHMKPLTISNKNTNTKHEFSISPSWKRMIEHPLMAKYPHLFKEVQIKEERPPLKHLKRNTFSKPDSKISNIPLDNEEMQQSANVEDLVKAVVPGQNNYKVSVRLIPHEDEGGDETNPAFKEIHTSINKTYNKNGLLYSSLVNVSEISHVKVADTNSTLSHNFKSQTPNITNEVMKASDILTNRQSKNNKIHTIVKVIRSKPIEITTKPSEVMNLMDIILPSTPRRVIHLTLADLGKLLCDAMKLQNKEKDASVKTTTLSTTMMTTVSPERTSTQKSIPTPDPLKIKLLKSISQNEQLTIQILDRIDQNTDILQTFLSKITEEIAKLPDIANEAIMERDKKNSLKIYTTTTSMTPSISLPRVQQNPQKNIKPAATRRQSFLVQSSPLLKNHIKIDRSDLPTVQTNNDQRGKYFLDKTSEDIHKEIVTDGLTNDNTTNRIENQPNRNIKDEVTRTFKHTKHNKITENKERKSSRKRKRELYKARLPRSSFPDYNDNDYGPFPPTTTKKPEEKPQKDSEFNIWIRSFFKNLGRFAKNCKYFYEVSSKHYWRAIQREIRNLGPVLKWVPTKQFLVDYYNNNFTMQPKPEAEAAITKGLGYMIRQVYGIDARKYDDNLIPKYYFKMRNIKTN